MADNIILVPVYRADDTENGKIEAKDLFNKLKTEGKKVYFSEDIEALERLIKEFLENGTISQNDLIIFSGAGSISKWAYEITKNMGEVI